MLRIASPLMLAASVALLVACSREATPVESPAPAPPASSPESTESEGAPPARPAGKRAPCTLGQDQTCNGDPSVSALWGKCLPTGTCECNPGFELAPTGYCTPAK